MRRQNEAREHDQRPPFARPRQWSRARVRREESGRVGDEAVPERREDVRMRDRVRAVKIDFELSNLASALRGEKVRREEFVNVGRRGSRRLVRNGELGRHRQAEPV